MTHDERRALWQQRLADQQASGLSIVAWCWQQNITEQQFYAWRKRLATPGPSAAAPQWLAVAQVYLACGPTDLRKSIDGLAALVQQAFALDPFAPALFVFCNRQRDKLKILYWEHNGFWLVYRRLERGRFSWPMTAVASTRAVSRRQLQWLLDGLALEQRQAHPAVTARTVL